MKSLCLVYTQNNHCIGLCIVNTSNKCYTTIPEKLMWSFGFGDDNDYIRSYPGKLHNNSKIATKFANGWTYMGNYMLNILMKKVCLDIKNCNNNNLHYWSMIKQSSDISYSPTIKDIKSEMTGGCKTISKDNLWFCIDWEECASKASRTMKNES